MLLKINITLILVFIAWIFSGQYILTQFTGYDSWRILQLLILIFISNQVFFLTNFITFKFAHKIFIAVVVLLFASTIHAIEPAIAMSDACLHIFLCCAVYVCALQFIHHPTIAIQTSKIISLLPVLSLIFLPISIVLNQLYGLRANWYANFPNYRMLDDALLPCLFLVWFWQSTTTHKTLKLGLIVIATLYCLSFLLNGARSNLFAILSSFIILILLYRKQLKKFLFPFISMLLALTIYGLLKFLHIENIGSPLARATSSGRTDLWLKSIELWLNSPILGVGGGNFVLNEPLLFSAHPHNLALQWLSEWGLAGLVFIILSLYCTKKIYDIHQKLPIFLVGFFISFLFNASFSGTMIYPLSQILNMWCLALMFMYVIKNHSIFIFTTQKPALFICFIVICSIIILTFYAQDITCQSCMLESLVYPPRFWIDGHRLHLFNE